jgi:hypothetical protein
MDNLSQEEQKASRKLSLCISEHHAMKVCGGMKVQLHAVLTSAYRSEQSASGLF